MKYNKEIYKFIKFSIVGVSNTTLSFMVFFLLYKVAGTYYLLSSLFGYLAGLGNSYLWNLRWTFRRRHSGKIFVKFFLVNILALFSKLLVLNLLVERFFIRTSLAELMVIGLSIIINFVGNNFWTFRE